jgi:hypothetical protein
MEDAHVLIHSRTFIAHLISANIVLGSTGVEVNKTNTALFLTEPMV